MLNALDCWMSFCILILVAGTALYVEPVSKGQHVDASGSGWNVTAAPTCKGMALKRLDTMFYQCSA